ncbi:lytic murein transglycosylase [Patescibacteria group bacterium]|nr:lytic murein transglycosylase [Patescibacteria group bacterium]
MYRAFSPRVLLKTFNLKLFLISTVILVFALPSFFIFVDVSYGQSSAVSQEREQLEKELQELEQEIQAIEGDITKTQQEKKSLQNQIYILRNKIRKLDLQIEQSTKIIGDIRTQISDTTVSIRKTEDEIEQKRQQLGEILVRVYREDQKSMVEIIFTGSKLSDFFSNMVALEALSSKNRKILENVQDLSNYLKGQKTALESEKSDEENFVRIQILQKQESQSIRTETEQVLEVTKGKESEYQKLLLSKEKEAAAIRSRIFELIGVPEAPTFGEAVEIADIVSSQTGVRPAFLLAILTQESNIGKNVGQCFLRNSDTGDGVTAKGTYVAKVMKPSRDVEPFLRITKALIRDPFNTPVSCPIPSIGGYGGAMGPAQFIPSTWAIYEDRLKSILGRAADPWNIKDAFLASATYLADLGAALGTEDDEWCAAIRYFSGRCASRYRFYGDSVLAIAARYEQDIVTLKEVSN